MVKERLGKWLIGSRSRRCAKLCRGPNRTIIVFRRCRQWRIELKWISFRKDSGIALLGLTRPASHGLRGHPVRMHKIVRSGDKYWQVETDVTMANNPKQNSRSQRHSTRIRVGPCRRRRWVGSGPGNRGHCEACSINTTVFTSCATSSEADSSDDQRLAGSTRHIDASFLSHTR